MKQTILNVLNDKSFSVLSSEYVKESIATEIVEKLIQKGVYTEKGNREKNWSQKTHEDKVFGDVESVEKSEGAPYTPEEIDAWNREVEGCSTQQPYDKYKRKTQKDRWTKENPQLESIYNKHKEKLSEDIVDDKNKKYIYESPDGVKLSIAANLINLKEKLLRIGKKK